MTDICIDIMALTMVPGLGPVGIKRILDNGNGSRDELKAERARFGDISPELEEELEYMKTEGIRVVCCLDAEYPSRLRDIYDPPPVLYYKGDLESLNGNTAAVVGSRRCSMYGLRMAEKLSYDIAERGVTVVSGMARGIDQAAHRGALKCGGNTIAVLGSGFRHVYPAGSEKLVEDIVSHGAVVTEFSSRTEPSRSTFPRRNRIVSGMSEGVVVVEASRRSGAMITVDLALEQGREVFAVPGRADLYTSRGTNFLIQNGAKLVTCAEDILEEMDMEPVIEQKKQDIRISGDQGIREISDEEKAILEVLGIGDPVHLDHIIESSGADIKKLHHIMLRLEMRGLVKKLAGMRYVLARKQPVAS
ncbi:MAG: DNA-processing protein DprA [Candidatus Tantalella remota]|nr:DNA-processing protein DprA [Candidatus Tantalella remota]